MVDFAAHFTIHATKKKEKNSFSAIVGFSSRFLISGPRYIE